jgi:pimeloyl-ACP methyl ester carboxylesterase
MMGGAKAHYDGIVAFSQTDFTEDLKKITVPVFVMHGDDDQIVPYADSAPLSAKLLKNGTLKHFSLEKLSVKLRSCSHACVGGQSRNVRCAPHA